MDYCFIGQDTSQSTIVISTIIPGMEYILREALIIRERSIIYEHIIMQIDEFILQVDTINIMEQEQPFEMVCEM